MNTSRNPKNRIAHKEETSFHILCCLSQRQGCASNQTLLGTNSSYSWYRLYDMKTMTKMTQTSLNSLNVHLLWLLYIIFVLETSTNPALERGPVWQPPLHGLCALDCHLYAGPLGHGWNEVGNGAAPGRAHFWKTSFPGWGWNTGREEPTRSRRWRGNHSKSSAEWRCPW